MSAEIFLHPATLFGDCTAARFNLHAYRAGMECAEKDFKYNFAPDAERWKFGKESSHRRLSFNTGYEMRFAELERERMKRIAGE